jgi:hypothetical protein
MRGGVAGIVAHEFFESLSCFSHRAVFEQKLAQGT